MTDTARRVPSARTATLFAGPSSQVAPSESLGAVLESALWWHALGVGVSWRQNPLHTSPADGPTAIASTREAMKAFNTTQPARWNAEIVPDQGDLRMGPLGGKIASRTRCASGGSRILASALEISAPYLLEVFPFPTNRALPIATTAIAT